MSLLSKLRESAAQDKANTRPIVKPSDVHTTPNIGVKRDFERSEIKEAKEEAKVLGRDAREAKREFQNAIDETMASISEEIKKQSLVLDDSQMLALRGILKSRVSCLIGAAGTGKTTLMRIVIDQLARKYNTIKTKADGTKEKKIGIALCAFTGRAAQQLKRALPEEYQSMVSTAHSLLGFHPEYETRMYHDPITGVAGYKDVMVFKPFYTAGCKLPYDLIAVDELSMFPVPLWNQLIDALKPNARLIVIGDLHQLPPVMGASVLGYALRKWPVYELKHIHRQAAGNPIIENAHRILNGRMIQKSSNVHLLNSNKGSSYDMQTYVRQVMMKMREIGRYDPFRDAIITPWNKGPIGTMDLNEYFTMAFNPEKRDPNTKVILNKRIKIHTGRSQVEFALGDKVMITSNINDVEPPITNGMMGVVESINLNSKYDMKRSQIEEDEADPDFTVDDVEISTDFALEEFTRQEIDDKEDKRDEKYEQRQSSHAMTILFENNTRYTCSTAGDYSRVTFGYVITCHKAQGGEYPNVFIICHSSNGKMLSQEWLYTAFTRARVNVYVLHNQRGLEKAIKTQRIKGKTLEEKIKSYVIECKIEDDEFSVDTSKYPILFKPEEVA